MQKARMNTSIHPPEAASLAPMYCRDFPLRKKNVKTKSEVSYKIQVTIWSGFGRIEKKSGSVSRGDVFLPGRFRNGWTVYCSLVTVDATLQSKGVVIHLLRSRCNVILNYKGIEHLGTKPASLDLAPRYSWECFQILRFVRLALSWFHTVDLLNHTQDKSISLMSICCLWIFG